MTKQQFEHEFWTSVTIPNDSESCWEFLGTRHRQGYGYFTAVGEQMAHRVAWVLTHGPIKDGLHVLHKCDNPPCVNPDHLWIGTHQDNMRDAVDKGRMRGFPGEQHHQSKLTDAEVITIRERYLAGGVTQAELAAEYGMTQTAISFVLRNGWKHLGTIAYETIAQRHRQNAASRNHFNTDRNPRKLNPPAGEKHHAAKLAADDIRAIRQKAASGMTGKAIAEEYGLSHSHACKIIRRQAWPHID